MARNQKRNNADPERLRIKYGEIGFPKLRLLTRTEIQKIHARRKGKSSLAIQLDHLHKTAIKELKQLGYTERDHLVAASYLNLDAIDFDSVSEEQFLDEEAVSKTNKERRERLYSMFSDENSLVALIISRLKKEIKKDAHFVLGFMLARVLHSMELRKQVAKQDFHDRHVKGKKKGGKDKTYNKIMDAIIAETHRRVGNAISINDLFETLTASKDAFPRIQLDEISDVIVEHSKGIALHWTENGERKMHPFSDGSIETRLSNWRKKHLKK